jgi:hypothetical protein
MMLAVGLVFACGWIAPVMADETGMASIHPWRKVGKKTCLVDHEHAGSGTGINKKAAELSAIRSWISFTDLEYGSDWASFNNSVGKQMRCSAGSGSVQCDLLATACRPW